MKHLAELEEFERELEREFPISDSVIFENIDDPKIIDIKKDKKDKKWNCLSNKIFTKIESLAWSWKYLWEQKYVY